MEKSTLRPVYAPLAIFFLALLMVFSYGATSISAAGVAPDLGAAETFGLLADTLTTPEPAGTTTVHDGDAGAVTVTGTIGTPDGTFYEGAGPEYNAAAAALEDAIADANAQVPTVTGAAGADIGGEVLEPGVYEYPGAVNVGSDVTLRGNGVYIFQIDGTFDMAANTAILLDEGAQDCNIFWVPTGATTLAADTHFRGNLMSASAATTVGINTRTDGRILSRGAVTFTGPGPSDIFVPQACEPVTLDETEDPNGEDPLPVTGGDTLMTLLLGILLVGAGLGLVSWTRRRTA